VSVETSDLRDIRVDPIEVPYLLVRCPRARGTVSTKSELRSFDRTRSERARLL